MPISPTVLRLIFFFGLLGMLLLSAFYLRGRRLSFSEYIAWGLLTVLLPLLGPFLVVFSRPGQSRN